MNSAERTARADLRRWTHCLRRDVTEFIRLAEATMPRGLHSPDTAERQAMNLELAHAADRIWGDAYHWYKAVESKGLPQPLQERIAHCLDSQVREIVHHMRNITEHWEENRRHIESPVPLPGARSSIRWYLAQDLVNGPWSWTWHINRGYELGQVLSLNRLMVEIQKVDDILSDATQLTTSPHD